eukprot:gnl/TRDRNA2_/TRDRNA2_133819_c0_seq1.p1 gnl/TRDRNA2_/TRDRNA2_133819_c0~~gnl/TRDRNA2_/TRDRNA2_133819_c0_seq1.p1  ORF type:complete len:235 (+),score=36.44 gnl/TRDRNA2_/TRDRNA2_133819_c0_seq1:88-792(+)
MALGWHLPEYLSSGCRHDDVERRPPLAVVGYLPEYRHSGMDWEAVAKATTHLIFFSLEVGANGQLDQVDRLPGSRALAQAKTARDQYGTKLLVCVGGAGRSSGLSRLIAGEAEVRKKFAASVVKFLDWYGLDGLDVDFEPTERPITQTTWRGFANLISELSRAFRKRSPEKRKLLTVPFHPGEQVESFANLTSKAGRSITDSVDLFHAMLYDKLTTWKSKAKVQKRRFSMRRCD